MSTFVALFVAYVSAIIQKLLDFSLQQPFET